MENLMTNKAAAEVIAELLPIIKEADWWDRKCIEVIFQNFGLLERVS